MLALSACHGARSRSAVLAGSSQAPRSQQSQQQQRTVRQYGQLVPEEQLTGAASQLERLRGGAAPMGAQVNVGHEVPAPAPRRAKKASAQAAPAPLPATATPKRPHELVIEAGSADQEGGTATMHPSKLAELGMMPGDIVRLKGKRDREALCVLQESKALAEDAVAVAAVTRKNLMLGLGDSTKAYRCDDVKHAERIQILPFDDAMGGLTSEEIHEQLIKPYFLGADAEEGDAPYRPVVEGEILRFRHGAQIVECKVYETEPPRRCIVAPETEIELPERELDRDEEEGEAELGYDDIGGCDKELSKIRELVELPMRHPKVFTSVGVRPPRGVLIYGPPGCGKVCRRRRRCTRTRAHVWACACMRTHPCG